MKAGRDSKKKGVIQRSGDARRFNGRSTPSRRTASEGLHSHFQSTSSRRRFMIPFVKGVFDDAFKYEPDGMSTTRWKSRWTSSLSSRCAARFCDVKNDRNHGRHDSLLGDATRQPPFANCLGRPRASRHSIICVLIDFLCGIHFAFPVSFHGQMHGHCGVETVTVACHD